MKMEVELRCRKELCSVNYGEGKTCSVVVLGTIRKMKGNLGLTVNDFVELEFEYSGWSRDFGKLSKVQMFITIADERLHIHNSTDK